MRAESDLELIHTHHSAAERGLCYQKGILSIWLNHSVLPVNRTVSPCIPYTYYLTVNSFLFLLLPFPLLVEMPVPATLTLLGQHCSRDKALLARGCWKMLPWVVSIYPPPIPPVPTFSFYFWEVGISQDKETAAVLGKRNQSRLSNLWTISH